MLYVDCFSVRHLDYYIWGISPNLFMQYFLSRYFHSGNPLINISPTGFKFAFLKKKTEPQTVLGLLCCELNLVVLSHTGAALYWNILV